MNRFVIQFEIISAANTAIRYYAGHASNKMVQDFKGAYIYLGDGDELQHDLNYINDSYVIQSLEQSNFSDVKITVLVEAIGEDRHRIWIDSRIKTDVDILGDI